MDLYLHNGPPMDTAAGAGAGEDRPDEGGIVLLDDGDVGHGVTAHAGTRRRGLQLSAVRNSGEAEPLEFPRDLGRSFVMSRGRAGAVAGPQPA